MFIPETVCLSLHILGIQVCRASFFVFIDTTAVAAVVVLGGMVPHLFVCLPGGWVSLALSLCTVETGTKGSCGLLLWRSL